MAPTSRALAIAAAVLLPAAVLGTVWEHFQQPPELSGHAADFELRLAMAPPRVVVLGSSLAHRGVDLDVLARSLGVAREEVVMLQLPHAASAHWYAILKNRVFSGGYRPELVLVVGAMTTMLNHDLLAMDANVARLFNQLGEDEPVLEEKVFPLIDSRGHAGGRSREWAARYREELLEAYRDRALGALLGAHGRPLEGQALAANANERVFANHRMDYDLHPKAAALARLQPATGTADPFDVRAVSLLAEIEELARSHGSHVVYVRTPFPPSNPNIDVVPPLVEADALDLLAEIGSGFLDMRALPFDDSHFEDMRHMTRAAAVRFTRQVAERLTEMGALSGAPSKVVTGRVMPVSATREGAVDAVWPVVSTVVESCVTALEVTGRADLLAGMWARNVWDPPVGVEVGGAPVPWAPAAPDDPCTPAALLTNGAIQVYGPADEVRLLVGDEPSGRSTASRWIHPNSSLVLGFADGFEAGDVPLRVRVRAHLFGDGQARVRIGGEEVVLERQGPRGLAQFELAAPTGPWAAEIVSEGPLVHLRNVVLRRGADVSHPVGDPAMQSGASVRVIGGRVEDTRVKAEFDDEPPAVPFRLRLRAGPRGVGLFVMPQFVELADAPDSHQARPNRCSPVRLYEDEQPLAGHHSVCLDVARKRDGRSCHAGEVLYFAASDGSKPEENGRRYTVRLAEDRLCETFAQKGATTLRDSRWLYPGDTARFVLPRAKLLRFADGANRLELEVLPHLMGDAGGMSWRLEADGVVLAENTLLPGGPWRSREVFALEHPVPPRSDEVVLTLHNPSPTTFLLASMAGLTEDHATWSEEPVQPEEPLASGPPLWLADRVTRIGEVPPVPELKRVTEAEDGSYEARLFPLWPVSNSVMEKQEMGWWSPLRMQRDGRELVPAPSRKTFCGRCSDCFMHLGQAVLFKSGPRGPGTLVPRLGEALPLPTPRGRSVYWVYPGTALDFAFDRPWEGGRVTVSVRLWGATAAREQELGGVTLVVRDRVVPVVWDEEGVGTASVDVPATGQGAWSIRIASDDPRVFAVVEELLVTDARGPLRVDDPLPPD